MTPHNFATRSFWVSVVAYAVLCVVGWFVLPERVPMHFGGGGAVDRWASHTEAVLTMALLGAAMALLFWGLAVWVPRAPGSLLNINAKDKRWWLSTPERSAELRRRLTEDLHLVGAATMSLLVAVEIATILVADDDEPSLGGWFLLIPGVYVVGVIGFCIFLTTRRYRTPRDA